jgi:hypothetical protein
MTQNTISLEKNPNLPFAEDYGRLRADGFAAIEELGNAQWTDYNAHDPGITILEALTYALTELGYRTGFDIADLLTEESGYISFRQALFTARRILTNNPLTVNDFRKVLIDLPTVDNAWLLCKRCACETTFYAECAEDALFHAPQWRLRNPKEEQVREVLEHAVYAQGLYEVLLQLDRDAKLGDLNNRKIAQTASVDSGSNNERLPVTIELRFPDWAAELPALYADFVADNPDFQYLNVELTRLSRDRVLDEIAGEGLTGAELQERRDADVIQGWRGVFYADFTVSFEMSSGGAVQQFALSAVPVRFFSRSESTKRSTGIYDQLSAHLADFAISSIWDRYRSKLQATAMAIATARHSLHDYRNLAEDFCQITHIKTEDVAFCADIEVTPDADIEYVLAQVFYTIEKLFNPPVPFYTLSELQAEGHTTNAIFQGPPLNNGFIKDADLGKSDLQPVVNISDLYNELMDIPGILAIKHVQFTRYDDEGHPLMPAHEWQIPVRPLHIPMLYQEASRVLFYKNNLPFLARMEEVQAILAQLRGQDLRGKVPLAERDLPVPAGSYRELYTYEPVQYNLPFAYGVGPAGLDPRVTDLRRAQARQLKGYLMPFEQLLADMTQQLAQVSDLFSTDEQVDRSYFTHFFDPTAAPPEIADLAAISTAEATEDNLRALAESESTFHNRRNRFLDHMLARFGEQFQDYALMLYANADRIPFSAEKLIKDKIRFLRFYPRISADRGRAFNYRYDERWCDPRNTTGLSERIGRLLGLETLKAYFEVTITSDQTTFSATFELADSNPGGLGALLESISPIVGTSGEEVEDIIWNQIGDVIANSTDAARYGVNGDGEDVLLDEDGAEIARLATGRTAAEVIAFCADILAKERLYTVEHLLLRPVFPGSPLMGVCLDDCLSCGEEDPYSFRLTYVLQGSLAPFSYDIDLRQFADRTIRRETPSHLLPKICWVGNVELEKDDCAPIFARLINLLQQEQGMDGEAESTCDCSHALYDGFDALFQPWMSDQLLRYRPRDQWEDDLRTLFAPLVPGDFPCLASADGWDAIRMALLDHFLELAVNAYQFDRFEVAWCTWLEANDPFDWYALNQQLQRQTELWLLAHAGITSQAEACHCAELLTSYYGDRFRQWIAEAVDQEIDLADEATWQNHLTNTVWPAFREDLNLARAKDPDFCLSTELLANAEAWDDLWTRWSVFYVDWVTVSYRLEVLLRIFQDLRSIYPTATLHDCDDGSDDNPVRLDNTILGTL